MEGATRLASELRRALVAKTVPLGHALKAYERSQQRRAHPVQTLVPMVHSVGRVKGMLRSLRNTAFRLLPQVLSTPVFDATHRLALGWSFTVPDLGQGLYARLLGREFFEHAAQQCAALSDFHRGSQHKRACGQVEVRHGEGRLTRLLARLSGLPPALPPGTPLSVDVHVAQDGRETWHRVFGPAASAASSGASAGHAFTTKQWIAGEQMQEKHGWIVVTLDVVDTSFRAPTGEWRARFDHIIRGVSVAVPLPGGRALTLPLPRALCPVVHGITLPCVDEPGKPSNGWRFKVEVTAPTWMDSLLRSGTAPVSRSDDAGAMATALAALGGADGLDFVHSGVAEELARLAAAKGALVACYEGSIDSVE